MASLIVNVYKSSAVCLHPYFSYHAIFSMTTESCESILEALGTVPWLASDENRCAMVRALFIDIFNKTVSWLQEAKRTDEADDDDEIPTHLVRWMEEEAQRYFSNDPEYQVSP